MALAIVVQRARRNAEKFRHPLNEDTLFRVAFYESAEARNDENGMITTIHSMLPLYGI